jgi:spermidine/putrescine-binding protein
MNNDELGRQPLDEASTTRRRFLKGSVGLIGLTSVGGILQACGGSPTTPSTSGAPSSGSPGVKLEGPVNWLTSTPALADPDAIGSFEQSTGVKIASVPYGTFDEMLAKVRGGQTPYDIINMNDGQVPLLAREGLIQPINSAQMRNFANMFPIFRDRETLNFDGKVWGVPQFFGANAIAYNSKKIPQLDSVGALFDEKYKGRIAMRDSSEDSLLVGALRLGFKQPYRMGDEQLAQVKALLIKQKPLVRVYWRGIADLQAAFANEEVWLAWSQLLVVEPLKKAGLDMGWVWPKEGVGAFLAVVALAKTATHRPAAEAFLNYLMGEEWGLIIAKKYGYAPCSETTFGKMTPDVRQKVNIDTAKLATLTFKEEFDRPKWNKIWDEIKAA